MLAVQTGRLVLPASANCYPRQTMANTEPARTPVGPAPMSPARVAVALALLMGLQPITTDLYLPALPLIKQDLGASMAATQATLSALILAFGFGQLFWGPVTDRYGRRPVLLLGLALYTLASLGATWAPSIRALVAWRVVQGACLAAAVVCGRSMVRDCYTPREGVQVMARGFTGLGLIALGGPLLGGLLAEHHGFRATLAVLAVSGAGILVFVWAGMSETLARPNPQATRLGPLLHNWARIARHPTFLAYTALTAGTYGGLFAWLAGSSFVLIDLMDLSRAEYGGVMATGCIFYLWGTLTCRRWAARDGVLATVRRGAWFTLAGALLMGGLSLAGMHRAWAVIVPTWLYVFAHGIHQTCGQTGVVAPFPRLAGTASALAGFLLSATAFAIGQALGLLMNDSALPLTLGVAAGGLVTTVVAWTLVQRHGEPDEVLHGRVPPPAPPDHVPS